MEENEKELEKQEVENTEKEAEEQIINGFLK